MTDDLVANALKHKRKERLSAIEIQQIGDLQKAYGIHNVLIAIQCAKTTQIKDIGRMLLQHCGFRSNLAASINKVIPDKEAAMRIFPYEKFMAACHLEEATQPIEWDIEKDTKCLLSLWQAKDGYTPSVAVENAIRSAVQKYGTAFAKSGIQIVLKKPAQSEHRLIPTYQGWLDLASTQGSIRIVEMLSELGISPDAYKLEIPQPLPLRLEKYFVAKANRHPSQEEKAILWSKLQKHKPDDIIHAMSCVPSSEFSIEKIEKILSLTEPFGVEFVASIKKKATIGQFGKDDQDAGDWEIEEDEYGEMQSPHDPMRDSVFYDYSRFDENALDGEDYLDDYLIDEEE